MAGEVKDKETSPNKEEGQQNSNTNSTPSVEEKIRKEAEEKVRKELEEKHKQELEEAKKQAAKIEKEKLYETIDKERKEKAEKEALLKKYQEEDDRKKEEEEKKKLKEMDTAQRIEYLESQLKKRDEITDKERQRMEKLLEKQQQFFTEELTKKDLETHREKVINKYEGKIIPELVFGNTKEEIEEAAKKASERYLNILKSSEEAAKNKKLSEGALPGTEGKTPGGQGSSNNTSKAPRYKDIMAMSDEDFDKYSDDFLTKFTSTKKNN